MTSRSRSERESVFFFQAEDGIRDIGVTGVQTCALPIWRDVGPRLPAIGIPPGSQPRSDVSPHGPEESTIVGSTSRSEERRVGKECRSWWTTDHGDKKEKVICHQGSSATESNGAHEHMDD